SYINFDDKTWIRSLEDHQNWGCIGIQGLVSIFTLLDEDKRKKLFQLIGKRILYSETKDYKYLLQSDITGEVVKLSNNIFPDISKILKNKDADYGIFATVVDLEETGDFFTCQIYCPVDEEPQLLIHCIQPVFRVRYCKLNIRLMIVGYDTDFNLNLKAQPKLEVLEKEYISSEKLILSKELIFTPKFEHISFSDEIYSFSKT